MKISQINFTVAVFTSLFSLSAFSATGQTFEVVDGGVGFLAIGKPSAIKIRGKGIAPKGEIQVNGKEVTSELNFDENSLTTGIDVRDHHMKVKYLQTEKYPTAKFKITKLTLPSDFSMNGYKAEKVPFEGELTLHGVTKPVKGSATIASNAGMSTGHIEFGTQITDYGIDIPSYVGVKVADHVDVDVDLTAKPMAATATEKGTKKK